ncbi:probable RNA-dependent RNA polymerase 5 [Chenopodium quinoa]|uniref:probable RNA-dependent RNA polymerase 5 n=1 Tax=Chenopodium quinoa TaxID=63459 RepID=UPI000B78B9EF|nr:probable RNA-dependent RNA polymerase 5 [Chenopodium quinoa]
MAVSPSDLPRLPAAVVEQLHAIYYEKSQPPASAVAIRYLSDIGEQESLKILDTIRNYSKTIRNLSGFIVHLAKKNNSHRFSPPSPQSPLPPSPAVTPQGNKSSENKRKRESDHPGGVSTARRVCDFNSPAKGEGEPNVPNSRREIVLDAFEKLEFRKAFLILNYIGRLKLEDVVSADQIMSYQRLSMRDFEVEIWNDFGKSICQEKERVLKMNWETRERYNYHCHVDAQGNCRFKGPYPNKAATLLQKVVGDENVLIVKLMEQETESLGTEAKMQSSVFNKISEGIFIGKKCYQFFVYKDGGKEEKMKDPTSSPVKCYFVCMEGFATLLRKPPQLLKISVQDARCLFMHIHKATNPSNYMARFSLILSKTITLELNFDDLCVEITEDVPCRDGNGDIIYGTDNKALIFTDGTGFISEDLALRCPHNCFNGYVNNEENDQGLHGSLEAFQFPDNYSGLTELRSLPSVPPLLIQFRMFHKGKAIKGTVLVNRKLPPITIQVRKSMLKIESDEKLSDAPSVNSFEVVATSNKPKDAALSKNLIALLSYGGVPKDVFLAMLWEALTKPWSVLYRTKAATRVAVNWDFTDEFIVARMIASGIPLDEPFLRHRLSDIAKEEMKSLKGGKLPVSDSFYLMGTADPTETLNAGEVCIILDQGQISGPVLVYRNPGTHPGDIHILTAKYVEGLKEYVGNAKYGIFFPSKGLRSMADEIAGGDYDGDMYWVSRNSELLKYFKPSEPWKSNSQLIVNKKSLPSPEALELELIRQYRNTRFHPNKAMGIAADWWIVYMDRLLTLGDECADEKVALKEKIYKLIDLYYDALDAPKKGITINVPERLKPPRYPHFMGRGEHCTYKSKSILGDIHDIVDQLSAPIKLRKLECFEANIPEMYIVLWKNHYDKYRFEMQKALNESKNADFVYQKYRKELYGGVDTYDSDMIEKAWKEIRLEALAIYHVCYDYAIDNKDPKKCGFAWKVAGDALWKIYLKSTGEKPILFAPSVLRQMMR